MSNLIQLITDLFKHRAGPVPNETLENILTAIEQYQYPVTSSDILNAEVERQPNDTMPLLQILSVFKSGHHIMLKLLEKNPNLIKDNKIYQEALASDRRNIYSSYITAFKTSPTGEKVLQLLHQNYQQSPNTNDFVQRTIIRRCEAPKPPSSGLNAQNRNLSSATPLLRQNNNLNNNPFTQFFFQNTTPNRTAQTSTNTINPFVFFNSALEQNTRPTSLEQNILTELQQNPNSGNHNLNNRTNPIIQPTQPNSMLPGVKPLLSHLGSPLSTTNRPLPNNDYSFKEFCISQNYNPYVHVHIICRKRNTTQRISSKMYIVRKENARNAIKKIPDIKAIIDNINELAKLKQLQDIKNISDLPTNIFMPKENMANIAEAFVFYRAIKNFKNIISLNLEETQIELLPEDLSSSFRNLIHLQVSKNNLTKMPNLEGLSRLMFLYAASNKLTVAPNVSKNINLHTLILDDNPIKKSPNLNNLLKLAVFCMHSAKLSQFPDFSRNNQLQCINLRNNKIQKISSLENLTKLKAIILSHNKINQVIDFKGNNNIVDILLNNNKLILPPININKPNLHTLNLSNNNLVKFPECLANANTLLSNNYITHFNVQELKKPQQKPTSAKILDLKGNPILILPDLQNLYDIYLCKINIFLCKKILTANCTNLLIYSKLNKNLEFTHKIKNPNLPSEKEVFEDLLCQNVHLYITPLIVNKTQNITLYNFTLTKTTNYNNKEYLSYNPSFFLWDWKTKSLFKYTSTNISPQFQDGIKRKISSLLHDAITLLLNQTFEYNQTTLIKLLANLKIFYAPITTEHSIFSLETIYNEINYMCNKHINQKQRNIDNLCNALNLYDFEKNIINNYFTSNEHKVNKEKIIEYFMQKIRTINYDMDQVFPLANQVYTLFKDSSDFKNIRNILNSSVISGQSASSIKKILIKFTDKSLKRDNLECLCNTFNNNETSKYFKKCKYQATIIQKYFFRSLMLYKIKKHGTYTKTKASTDASSKKKKKIPLI